MQLKQICQRYCKACTCSSLSEIQVLKNGTPQKCKSNHCIITVIHYITVNVLLSFRTGAFMSFYQVRVILLDKCEDDKNCFERDSA